MSEEYIKNEYLQEIINNPKITIILFENPPYTETTGSSETELKKNNSWQKSYVSLKMKEELFGTYRGGRKFDDLSNLFIWSAFKYYLRQTMDSIILFSPVKYFLKL